MKVADELIVLESAEIRLARVALLLFGQLLVRELQRDVTIALARAVSEDQVRLHLDDGHRLRAAVLSEHRRHSDFSADQTLRHTNSRAASRVHRAHHGQAGLPAGG